MSHPNLADPQWLHEIQRIDESSSPTQRIQGSLVDSILIGQDAVEGHYFSTHYHPDVGSPKSAAFVESYKKRWKNQDGSPKVPDAMAALGYDSAMILADAIKRAGSTEGPKVRDALAATKDFDAVTGRITINASRDATKSAVILQVKGGKFRYVETINP